MNYIVKLKDAVGEQKYKRMLARTKPKSEHMWAFAVYTRMVGEQRWLNERRWELHAKVKKAHEQFFYIKFSGINGPEQEEQKAELATYLVRLEEEARELSMKAKKIEQPK